MSTAEESVQPAEPTVVILVKADPGKGDLGKSFPVVSDGAGAQLSVLGISLLEVPESQVGAVLAELRSQPGVIYAEPDGEVNALELIPNDPLWPNQPNLVSIGAPRGWEITTGSSAVTVAILDTGVDTNHADLAPKLVPGYDFVNRDSNPRDDNGHGTHVAGAAAAVGNNGIGISGVSWGARIMPVKVLNSGGTGSYSNVAAGVIWAADNGAGVINFSLGGVNPSDVLNDALNYAATRGVVLVAAAGNSGASSIMYPARYPQVIAVGAVDQINQRAWLSNYGPELDVAAPGMAILSTEIGGYGYRSGTSMAAPQVSGLAAILAGLPGGNSGNIQQIIETTALDLAPAGRDEFTGSGLIQVEKAVRALVPEQNTEEDQENTLQPTRLPGWIILTPTLRAVTAPPTMTLTSVPTAAQTALIPAAPADDVTGFSSTQAEMTQAAALGAPTPPSGAVGVQTAPGGNAWQGLLSEPGFLPLCSGLAFILAGVLLAGYSFHQRRAGKSG